jgi:hypothetical protein
MERDRTLQILKTLADGIDPATGEQFPGNSSYQHPETVRALYSAIRILESGASPAPAAVEPRKPGPANAGRPWSQEEDLRLGKAFDSGKTIDELADAHQRSRVAIEARLAKLGRIEAPPNLPSRRQRSQEAREPVSAYR